MRGPRQDMAEMPDFRIRADHGIRVNIGRFHERSCPHCNVALLMDFTP